MKFLNVSLVLITVLMLCAACEENPVEEKGENIITDENILRSQQFVTSADSVISRMIEAEDAGARFREVLDYVENAKNLYKMAATLNPDNSRANFGAGFLTFQQLLENPDMKYLSETLETWADDVDNLDYSRYYVTRYFMFGEDRFRISDDHGRWDESLDPFQAFMVTMYFVQDSLSKPDLISLLQNIIDTTVIETLDEAIAYLDKILDDESFVFSLEPYNIEDGEDVELDLGEAYMISALMHVIRGNLKIMTAYQYTIPGLTGNDDLADMTTLISLLKTQDLTGGNFLKLRSQTTLPSAKQDFLYALSLVNSGVDFIKSETDDQSNDLIKQADLTRADSEIASEFEPGADDIPLPLLRGTSGIIDLVEAIETMISGPFEVELKTDTETIDLTVNISAFLDNGISDFKAKLPYHEWADLDMLQINYHGPGISTWTEDNDNEEFRMVEVPLIEYYEDAIDETVWDHVSYLGNASKDGIVTIRGYYDWQSGSEIDITPNTDLTSDGAFSIDGQSRLCITREAYDAINNYIQGLPRDNRLIFDLANWPGNFPKNYSPEAPFGTRDNTGMIRFAGTPSFDEKGMSLIYLVDRLGNNLAKDAFPQFPDPTFGGVFPGMTQQRLEEIAQ